MNGHRHRRVAVAVIAFATVALGGCASVSDHAQNTSLAALAKTKPQSGKDLAYGAETAACKRDPFASTAPMALPRPGQMPAATPLGRIQARRLRVGVDQNSLGLGYFNPNASPSMEGFDIDLVREIARAIFGHTRRITYVALSTAQRPTAIVNDDVDLVASAFSVNCERRTRMLFSSVYHVAKQRLLVRKDSKVTGLKDPDLRGERVCVTKTSTSFKRLEASSAKTGVKPLGVELRPDCLVALHEGEAAAITSDDAILLGFQRQDPLTKIVGPSIAGEHYGIAVNRSNPMLVRFINGVLRRLRRSGCLGVMRRHWLSALTVPTRDRAYARCSRGRT